MILVLSQIEKKISGIFFISVINSSQFSICDTSKFGPFVCGIVKTVLSPVIGNHLSYEKAQMQPKVLECEFSVERAGLNSHIAFVALERFQENYHRLPEPW